MGAPASASSMACRQLQLLCAYMYNICIYLPFVHELLNNSMWLEGGRAPKILMIITQHFMGYTLL